MEIKQFDPKKVLGKSITDMSRQELCEFISALCQRIMKEVGTRGRRGGIYPDNISVDENGEIGIGPEGSSPWEGEELKYVAPELYWNGKTGAASDVYSVGLLLYYGVAGRLPLEGECADPQLRRMNGDDIKAPKNAGRRLGEIIERALKFRTNERYQTLEELRVVLDACVKNLYLSGMPSSEAIFRKSDDSLSDVERMMINIIEKQTQEEEEAALAEPEEIKLYEPASADMESRPGHNPVRTAAPKLEQRGDPDLTPVVPSRSPGAAKYARTSERERKIAEEVKKRRRRPMAVILVLCALLVVVAIIFNAMLKDFQLAKIVPDSQIDNTIETIEPDPFSGVPAKPAEEEPEAPEEPEATPRILRNHGYDIFVEDVSWTEARERCSELGGHLAVISNEEEFNKVVELAETTGVDYVWIGCHRVEGQLLWETTDEGYFLWGVGEPSEWDRNDNVSEDYIMLWRNNGGWFFNDNRNDPNADYPQMYSGNIAFICEYEDSE